LVTNEVVIFFKEIQVIASKGYIVKYTP